MLDLIRNKDIQKYISQWLAYWLSVMGIYILILKPMGINHLHYVGITIFYYITSALVGLKLFFPKQNLQYVSQLKMQIVLYLIAAFLFVYITTILGELIPLPAKHREYLVYKEFFYPLMFWKSSFSKLSDLIFQQFLIISLVLFFKDKVKDDAKAIWAFTWIFFLLHVPLFFVFGFAGIVFIVPSLLAGVVFSYCILRFKWGVFLSMCIHQSYYLALAILMRVVPYEFLL